MKEIPEIDFDLKISQKVGQFGFVKIEVLQKVMAKHELEYAGFDNAS